MGVAGVCGFGDLNGSISPGPVGIGLTHGGGGAFGVGVGNG